MFGLYSLVGELKLTESKFGLCFTPVSVENCFAIVHPETTSYPLDFFN